MSTSTDPLAVVVQELTSRARERGFTDTAWAERAGVRKETLSRLRGRATCDFQTLSALAGAVGAELAVADPAAAPGANNRHFPPRMDRDYERRLLNLCASRTLDPDRWEQAGPKFFMAGLAVMLAGTADFDRRSLLALAETLHPGASEPAVFSRWLATSPVRPSRFLPMVGALANRAA
jgi:DNA-binding phage protein